MGSSPKPQLPPPPVAPPKPGETQAIQVETAKQQDPSRRRGAMTPGSTILTLGSDQSSGTFGRGTGGPIQPKGR